MFLSLILLVYGGDLKNHKIFLNFLLCKINFFWDTKKLFKEKKNKELFEKKNTSLYTNLYKITLHLMN